MLMSVWKGYEYVLKLTQSVSILMVALTVSVRKVTSG